MSGHDQHWHDAAHEHQADSRSPVDPAPTVYACKTSLAFDPPRQIHELQARLESLLVGLTQSLRLADCTLIGHIKGLLTAGEEGALFFSVTAFDRSPKFKGAIKGSIAEANLTLNAVVYGVEYAEVVDIVDQSLRVMESGSR